MSARKTVIAATVGLSTLFVADNASLPNPDTWVARAEARIGRPATPLSYAGVARRTTRRAAAVGVGVGAVGCRTVYNAYGQAITRCY